MPLTDPSIIAGIKPPSFMNPADVMGFQNMMYKNQLGQLELSDAQRQVQSRNALTKILQQPGAVGPDGMPTANSMQQIMSVDPQTGMAMQQNFLARRKEQVQMNEIEQRTKKLQDEHAKSIEKEYANNVLPLAQEVMRGWNDDLTKNVPANVAIENAKKRWIEGLDELQKGGANEGFVKKDKTVDFHPAKFAQQIQKWQRELGAKVSPFTNLNPKDYTPESLKAYQQSGDVSDLKAVVKDTRANQEWSDPYPLQGATVQKNLSTGEIRTAVSRVPASIINLSTGGSNQPEQLTSEGKEAAAMKYLMFGTMPQVGWGDKKTRQQIINQAADAGKKLGLSPMEQAILPQDNKVKMKAVGNLVNWGAGLKKSQQTLEQSLDLAISYAEKVTPSDLKRINQAVIAGKREFGSGPAAGYGLAMMTVEREYGRLMMGPLSNAMMPVEAIKSTHGLMSTADSLDALREMRSVMRKDAQYVIDGVDSQVGSLRGSIQNMGKDTPSTSPAGKNTNEKGWKLHTDSKGNKAYVSPDGKQFEEAK